MENSSSYSKDPDYLTHGFSSTGGMEFQQHSAPPTHCHPLSEEQHDTGPHSTSVCNGTPSIRRDIREFSNTLQQNQRDRKGKIGVSVFKCTSN